jgi:hypothetical protein
MHHRKTTRTASGSFLSPRLKWAAKLALAIVLFLAVATTVGWGRIGVALMQADPRLIVTAWCIGLLGRVGQAMQMGTIMRRVGIPVPTRQILFANSQATLYGLVVPGDVAAGVAKWSHLSAFTGRRSLVLNAMIYNRIMLLSPWLFAGLAAISVRNPWDSQRLLAMGIMTTALAVLGLVLFYHPRFGPRIDRLLITVSQKLLFVSWHRRVVYVFDSVAPFRRSPWPAHAATLAAGFANVGISLATQLTMAAAVGITIGWLNYVWIAAIQKCLRQLPVSVHGIGVNQITLILLLGQFGVPSQQTLSFGILGLTNVILFALIGLAWQLIYLMQEKRAINLKQAT